MKWTPERRERVRAQWGRVSIRQLAESEATSVGAVYRIARQLGLPIKRRSAMPLRKTHQAIRNGGTRYPHSVISAKRSARVLVPGRENRKLGLRVTKGRWAGKYLYSVTLEERKSCPSSCLEWTTCYGNSLNWPSRIMLDGELVRRLDIELEMAAARHPGGFLVRLHVLGDFGRNAREGLPYVAFWARKMRELPEMHLFGFTAHNPSSAVGAAILDLNREFPERCRIRFSGHVRDDGLGAVVIDRHEDSRHVVCPFETDHPRRPKDCGACGLCWSMTRTVEFVRH